MKLPAKIRIDKIKGIPKILAIHAFFVILVLILADLVLGAFLFYIYIVIPNTSVPEVARTTSKFKYDIYQEVLKQWEEKETLFNESNAKKYENPFTPSASEQQQ